MQLGTINFGLKGSWLQRLIFSICKVTIEHSGFKCQRGSAVTLTVIPSFIADASCIMQPLLSDLKMKLNSFVKRND